MPTVIENATVLVGADYANLIKGLSQAAGAVEKWSQQTVQKTEQVSKSQGGMGDVVKMALGVFSGQAMRGAVQGIGKMVTGVVKMGVELAKSAAPIPMIAGRFEQLGGSIERMREGTMGMTADVDLMKNFNLAATLVSTDFAQTLPDAMQYLTQVAGATGESMDYMLTSLIRGVGRLSPMILDNLGIQVDMGKAYEKAAQAMGKVLRRANSI